MKTKKLILAVTIFILILLSGCSDKKAAEKAQLSELQITACNSADTGNTCNTRLGDLGVVTKEQCCQALGKCC